MQGMNQNRTSTIDVPVRILVPSESVGAIIGKGGQTIRQLTQQTRAKVDVYRGDPMTPTSALQEKVITIRGQPENCINACREILKVMKNDAENKGKPNDLVLKVLAHNDYIGRIIGKQGNIINSIKKDTETTVTVSSINDISMNVERVITVKGELENMIKALEIIHQKIKSAFENDTKTFGAQAIMMGGIPPLPMAPPPYAAYNPGPTARFAGQPAAAAPAAAYPNFYPQAMFPSFYTPQGFIPPQPHPTQQNFQHVAPPPPLPPQPQPQPQQQQQQPQSSSATTTSATATTPNQNSSSQQQNNSTSSGQQNSSHSQQQQSTNDFSDIETVYLYIPNVAVGALIGTKGQCIKTIIKASGASVKITPLSPEESKTATERQVVIQGLPESQYKAQYFIYEKIRQERFANDDNVKLRVEIHVPPQIVGRIIGKMGKNVRDLQRSTGATIKLPEDVNQTQSNTVVVRIHGTFNSSQAVQQRIQMLINQGLRGQSSSNRGQNNNGGVQMQPMINHRQTNGNSRNNKHRQHQNQNQQQQQQQNGTSNNQQSQAQQQSGNNSTTNSTPTTPTNTSNNQQQSANTSTNNDSSNISQQQNNNPITSN